MLERELRLLREEKRRLVDQIERAKRELDRVQLARRAAEEQGEGDNHAVALLRKAAELLRCNDVSVEQRALAEACVQTAREYRLALAMLRRSRNRS